MADHTRDEVRVRRATPGDRDAVIDINENVYDGNDYLPTIYEQLVDNEAHYAAYVAELDDKMVSIKWTLIIRLAVDSFYNNKQFVQFVNCDWGPCRSDMLSHS